MALKYLMDENVVPAFAIDRHIPGIFLLNPELRIGQNIDELLLIADGSIDGEYQDQIIHLPLT
jgi:hypothetical protein